MKARGIDRALVIRTIAILLGLGALIATLWRVQRGVEFTDEAYYVAMPARFVMGDRPFVDELNIGQTAGLLLYPFVRLYAAIAGWTGIYFFIRILYVAFFAVVGGATFTLAKTHLPRASAILVGVGCVCYIPYSAPGLSYNTLGGGLLAIGLFLGCHALTTRDEGNPRFYRDPIFWSGAAHAAACFAYPTVVVATILEAFVILLLANGRHVRTFGLFCAGGAAFVMLLVPTFVKAGMSSVRLMAEYFNASGPPPANPPPLLDRVATAFAQFIGLHPDLWKHAALLAVAAILVRRWPLVVGLLLVAVPFYVKVPATGIQASLHYVSCFACFGVIFGIALRNRRAARTILLGGWLPSIAAGLATGMSSGNGIVAAGVGLFPAAIASVLLLAMWIDETSKRWSSSWLRALVQLAPVSFVVVMLQYELADDAVYRDHALSKLTTRITEGPYKGLYTFPDRKRWLGVISADIRAYAGSPRLLFYYDFPAGYLIADRPPLVPSVWIFGFPQRAAIDSRYFHAHAKPGEHVFRLDGGWNPNGTSVDKAVADRCELVGQREGYSIYVVR